MKIWPGKPYPLGATWDGKGTNFALFSQNANNVELCLFDSVDAAQESERIPLFEQTDYVFHCYLPNVKPGQLYGYRVSGPFEPEKGLLFNPTKLLLDPYAKAISGPVNWGDSNFAYPVNSEDPDRDLQQDEQDNTANMPRCIVIDAAFDWDNDASPGIPFHEAIVYEVHVKGFTKQHPDVDQKIQGTYEGLASPTAIEYFQQLGINTVELLPIQQFVSDKTLIDKGLSNYWGYNTIGFFAPHSEYACDSKLGEQVREFKAMVKTLHAAGIEVILDVVYNHTAEGNQFGPFLSFKGIDNPTYYRLVADNPRFYFDYTGTGNSLNMLQPRTLQLVMDSLRYWVTEMHVDGFRFDLASTLARGLHEVGKLSSFLDIIHQDPVISQVKLIAEPWDVGEGGYQVGNFPVGWAEWNGKYRDTVRKFWKGEESQVAELAYRLSGSSDLYQHNGRSPYASVNFVVAHDGFTLNDLVSYNEKHNDANGEDNNDGETSNNSWNCGVEGPTEDPEIKELRERQKRNFLATLLLSQGVPMICGGDEFGRSQSGNNNAYCQDDEISWFDWKWTEANQNLFEFTRWLIQLRKEFPILHKRRFFQGRSIQGNDIKDIRWIRADGQDMAEEEWQASFVRSIGMLLNGQAMQDEFTERGERITDDVVLLLFNSYWETVPFVIPGKQDETEWEVIVDTNFATPGGSIKTEEGERRSVACGETFELMPRSVVFLRQPKVDKSILDLPA